MRHNCGFYLIGREHKIQHTTTDLFIPSNAGQFFVHGGGNKRLCIMSDKTIPTNRTNTVRAPFPIPHGRAETIAVRVYMLCNDYWWRVSVVVVRVHVLHYYVRTVFHTECFYSVIRMSTCDIEFAYRCSTWNRTAGA